MSDYLPDSLLTNILCRLPIESLLRFKCVCKQWCCLISSPDFITRHLSHSLSPTATATATATPLLLIRHLTLKPVRERYFVYLDPSKTEKITLVKDLKVPMKVVGFCNGLFCLCSDNETILLWNPAIRKRLSLPMPRIRYGPNNRYRFHLGFGFDPNTLDFKVVRLAYLQRSRYISYLVPPEVEVYSLNTGLWKMVNSRHIHCKLDWREEFNNGCYINGAIHWGSHYKNEHGVYTNRLLVFDVSDETFSEIGLPQRLVHACPWHLSVTLSGDQISVIWHETQYGNRCVVWVMNQYGIETWTEKFVVVLDGRHSRAIGFRKNGEILLEKCFGDLLSYDPKTKSSKYIDDEKVEDGKYSFLWSKYVESLVLLDGSSGAIADPSEHARRWGY